MDAVSNNLCCSLQANGFSFVVAAIGRIELVMTNNYTIPTTPKTCMLEKLWPIALIIAG